MNRKYVKGFSMLVIALLMLSMLMALPIKVKAVGAGYATIYVSPDPCHVTAPPTTVGSKIPIEVRIYDYDQVASWQVKLIYDPTLIDIAVASDVAYEDDDPIFPPGTYPAIPASMANIDAHHSYVMMTAATYGAVEYGNFTTLEDNGLMEVNFTVVAGGVPPPLTTYTCPLALHADDTWTCDEMVEENEERSFNDGVYEIEGVVPKPDLWLSPTSITKPDIPGDRIVGTDRAKFSIDILIKNVDRLRKIILGQFAVTYNATLLDVIDVVEGTFMNNTVWAPYNTAIGWIKDPGKISGFILINTNSSTGEWDWPERPNGEGLFATIEFEAIYQKPEVWTASCPIKNVGVFGEFFLDDTINWVPYSDPVNATYTIHGYYWANPIAAFSWSPPTPLVGSPVTFDASASVGFRNVLGVLVPDITYLKNFTWNFGDGNITWVPGPIIVHTYGAMGAYPVTLTVKDLDDRIDTESRVIDIVFGRLIDVYTQYGPPFGGQGINATSDMFWPQKPVILTAILTYNGDAVQHKLVAFEIISPTGYWDFIRVAWTDANGIAIIYFGLPWPCDYPEDVVFGIWTVIAKADIQCVTTEDWLWFKVYWYCNELTVTPKETEYHKCEYAEFDIHFECYSMQPRWVLVTVTVYDDLNVPIGQTSTWILVGNEQLVWCEHTDYDLTLRVHIPKYAFVGVGKVFVNTFWDWPIYCGYPLSPEATATFKILK